MSIFYKVSILLTAATILLACGGVDAPSLPTISNNNETAKLTKSHSAEQLETKIKDSLIKQYGRIYEPVYYLASLDSNQEAAISSSTNTQEINVDEADRLKTDGNYLYFSKVNTPEINIIKANENNAPLVGSFEVNTLNDSPISGLYLRDEAKQLIALAGNQSSNAPIWSNWFEPYFWQEQKTELFSIDINDPETPKQQNKLSVDGRLISSRRIGSTLYLATRHTPYIDGLILSPENETEVAQNKQLIAAASINNMLPQYRVNNHTSQTLFSASECFVVGGDNSTNEQNSVISLLAINLNDVQAKPTGQCFAGNTETVYTSSEAIYLATTQYSYDDDNGELVYSGQPSTEIHKFSLADTTPTYVGSGSVEGHLGWQQDHKPFRMSEHDDVLRVITYVGEQSTSDVSPARLYTLVENSAELTLDTLAQLPNETRPEPLGKVGEQIYASRFIGERGYLVTFRLTDPLYVLDLSDPSDPFIASALEIEGYSDYLHPVGENYLLGVGKNAIADDTADGGRGAWYQGVKLSLIDISDPTAPFEKQTINIGQRGTETAVSSTHHAFTSLLKGNTLEVALPISLHDTVDPRLAELTNEVGKPWFAYQWTRNELYRLDIDTLTGEMTTQPPVAATPLEDNPDFYYNWSWPHDRSAIIGDLVYYLNEDTITVQ